MPSLPIAAAALVLAAGVAAAGAGAATAPLPSPKAFLLVPGDFGRYAKAGPLRSMTLGAGLSEYLQAYAGGLVAGGKPIAAAASLAIVTPDASTAAETYQEIEVASHTTAGRRELAQEFGTSFATGLEKSGTKKVRLLETTVGTPRYGADTLVLPIVIKTNVGTARLPLVVTHVDRVVGGFVLISYYGHTVANASVTFETAALRKHLVGAFTVANTAAPTISGSAAQGQTLSVDEGGWSGEPSSYAYAWSRCVSATCTPIAGATAKTYLVAAEDSGATLQVAVSAANTVGSATASAPPTVVVP